MARRTSKNQLSSPQAGVEADGVEQVRTRLAELGITETDVARALAWARSEQGDAEGSAFSGRSPDHLDTRFRPFKATGSQRVTNEQIDLMRDQIGF